MLITRDREECPLCPGQEDHTPTCVNVYDPMMHAALLEHGMIGTVDTE